jgi:hypothetical protein
MEQSLVILQSNLQAAKLQDEKNDGEVQTLKRLLERAEAEKEKSKKAVLEAQTALEQAKTPVNYVRVSDNHSHCASGKTFVTLFKQKRFYNVILNGSNSGTFCGFPCKISNRRMNSVEDIKQGTVLIMADTANDKVLKGVVLSGAIKKYYGPQTGYDGIWDLVTPEYMSKPEFKLNQDAITNKKNIRLLQYWTVDWTEVDNLTEAWTNILKPSIRTTAFPLDPASFPKRIM